MSIDARANLENEHEKMFNELQTFLEDRTNNQKYGNANTIRLSIELAHEKMTEIKERENKTLENYQEIKRDIENKLDNL
jgi:hypothetical protein